MKKVLSLVLVLSMVLGTFSFAFAAPVSDVAGTEYEEAVTRLSSLGVLNGFPDGTFRPDATITRAQFAKTIVAVLGLDNAAKSATGLSAFNDVAASHWAAGYINIASRMGYIKGFTDGSFRPEAPITYEQAVTLVVRALGYEQAAEQRGGYPYGYLVVGAEEGVTDDVNGVSGLPASRGVVAQLVDNSLEVAMMIQVGYGSDTKWVVSGTEDTDEVTLLDKLGYERVEDRVVDYDADDSEITLEGKDIYVVGDDFDYEAVLGLELTLWVDGDDVIVYTVEDEPLFDAVTVKDADELTLVSADDDYKLDKDAVLVLDGEDVELDAFEADYAKVVLNDDDEIVWAQGFTWDDTLMIGEVEDDVLYGFDDEELDVDGYTLVKDGATIAADDIEVNDVVFYNEDAEYAVVYTNTAEGEIDRVYDSSFKFDGTVYSFPLTNYAVKYLDGDEVGSVDKDVLADMKDTGEVEVFFDFAGDVVFVVGDQGEADTSSYYAVVTETTTEFETRGKVYFTLDLLDENGEEVSYDVTEAFADEYDTATTDGVTTLWATEIAAGAVVEITVDEDGDLDSVVALGNPDAQITTSDSALKVDATYAKGLRLQDSAIVFWTEDADGVVEDYTVMTWADAADEFSEVEVADLYATSSGRVAVMVINATDANTENAEYTGLVTKVRTLKVGDVWEVTVEVAGEAETYLTSDDIVAKPDYEDQIVNFEVGDKSGEIEAIAPVAAGDKVVDGVVTTGGIDIADKTIKTDLGTSELVADAVIYDATDDYAELSLRDLEVGDTVDVYYVNEDTSRFVNYVVRTALADTEEATPEAGLVTITTSVTDSATTVVAINVPAGNTTVYEVKVTNEAGVTTTASTFVDKEFAGSELGINADGTYLVKVYNADTEALVESKAVTFTAP